MEEELIEEGKEETMESNKEDVIKILGILIKDEDWEIRKRTAKALGEIGSDKAVEPLINALRDDDWDVSWRADEALRKIGTPKALKAVEEYEKSNK